MPRIVPEGKGPHRYWEPAEPGGERRDHPLDDRRENVDSWTLAPVTSHCWGFRLVDARRPDGESRFQRRFGDPDRGFGRGRSKILVRFRDEETGGVAGEYEYRFDDHQQAADIFEELTRAAHPYGAVVHPKLRKAGVPYSRVS